MDDDLGACKGIANMLGIIFIVAGAILGAWYLAKILLGN